MTLQLGQMRLTLYKTDLSYWLSLLVRKMETLGLRRLQRVPPMNQIHSLQAVSITRPWQQISMKTRSPLRMWQYSALSSRLGAVDWQADFSQREFELFLIFLELIVESGYSVIFKLQNSHGFSFDIQQRYLFTKAEPSEKKDEYYKLIIDMEKASLAVPQVLPTNVPYLIVCSTVALFLMILLLVYRLKFQDAPPIVAILGLLLFNQLLMLLFEISGYYSNLPNWVCLVSITGTTFFRLAQYYWLFFVTRLVYREKAEPGKFIDLSSYVSRNMVVTYIPSVLVTTLILIVANIEDTQSEANCWHLISEKAASDYIIYLSSFVVPNFLAFIATFAYLVAIFMIKNKSVNSLCLFFPLTALPFMGYDLFLRLMTFFEEWNPDQILDIPLVCHPFAHGLIFLMVLRNLYRGKRPTSSDLTIKEESQKIQTFLVPPDQYDQ